MPYRLIFLMVLIAGFVGPLPRVCGEGAPVENKEISQLQVTSDSFQSNGMIPAKHTCDSHNLSPILRWKGVPKNAQSIALIADDPDAPSGDWVHWILYDLPSTVDMLPEGLPKVESLLNGEKQGTTNFGSVGYGGPCPPSGTHRYFFKIYALDTFLGLKAGATKKQLLQAMEGHIVAQGELVGRYERSSKK